MALRIASYSFWEMAPLSRAFFKSVNCWPTDALLGLTVVVAELRQPQHIRSVTTGTIQRSCVFFMFLSFLCCFLLDTERISDSARRDNHPLQE